jgi:hypothetical protein
MSVLVARDPSTARHIVFPWPDPVPWGAEVVCTDSEVAVICPNWEVGEQLGPGRHSITPPNPHAHILAYFISTTPQTVVFDRLIAAMDVTTGQPMVVHFYGSARIRIGDPLLLCHQLVGLPYHDLTTGIMRSAELSICRTIQRVIAKICTAHAMVRAITSPDAAAQIVNMVASAKPLTMAVTGLELVRFDELNLSIQGGEPIRWKASSSDVPAQPGASAQGEGSMDADLDADTQAENQLGARMSSYPMSAGGQQTGPHPPMHGGQQTGPHPPAPGGLPASRQSTPHVRMQSNPHLPIPPGLPGAAAVRRKTPALGMPAAPAPSGEAPLPSGSQVLVYWHDGLWHTGVVRHFEGGRYQVTIDGSNDLAWVQSSQIRPV